MTLRTLRTFTFALCLAALACACASSAPYDRPGSPSALTDEDRRSLEGAEGELEAASRKLDASQAAPAPDCGRACTLASNVCELAGKVCEIASRYPAGDPVAARCTDARARCGRAHEKTASCGCRGPG
jgi:hypothetical protein